MVMRPGVIIVILIHVVVVIVIHIADLKKNVGNISSSTFLI